VYIYEGGTVSYLQVLLSSTSINDFLTRYDMLKAIVDEDVRLITSINQERKALDTKKSDLDVKLKEAERTQLLYQQQQTDLAEQKKNKKTLLSSVDQEKDKLQAALDELEQSSRNLESYIRSRRSGGGGGSSVGTGSMTWPCPGYTTVTSPYGMRYHPILKVRKMHTGVDLNAPGGAQIVAADSGTVICAAWQTGYGKTIIIDHGNGTSTLYGHLDDYAVSDGDTVKKGQTIGYADSTGWSTGNHLHFEVRINGSPTSPLSYL
ncbi:MAG: peptidoglycan DD-metalloendopeptidase family protein, partial [Syntrophomonas sp.]